MAQRGSTGTALQSGPSDSVPTSTALVESLQPGTFRSLLPLVDDILSVLYQQSVGGEAISPAQAAEQVAPKAKELAKALEIMKSAAINLPGGHLSADEIRKLSEMLDGEGEKRKEILRSFEEMDMPITESLATTARPEGDFEAGSAMPSPAVGNGET